MAWSYDLTALSESKKDQVRFKLGDTFPEDPMLQDEEIAFLLEQNGDDVTKVAIAACDVIISKLSSIPDFKIGPYSETQGSRLTAYRSLRNLLIMQSIRTNAPIAQAPSTSPVFYYDMMITEGGGCDHD